MICKTKGSKVFIFEYYFELWQNWTKLHTLNPCAHKFCNVKNILWWLWSQTTDTQDELFFKYQIGRISFEVFYGILGTAIPSPWFLQKARILQDFPFGIGLWIWAVENLRSSHHASVVRDYGQSLKQSLKSILHTIAWLLCAPSVGCNAHHMAFDPLEFGHWKIWAPPPPKSTSEPAVAIDPIFGVHLHFWALYRAGGT